uniref:Meteorin-like protein n=1 Tax=Mola mola TaxID=94237 RepID=A0A3Q3XRJ6_MOLML
MRPWGAGSGSGRGLERALACHSVNPAAGTRCCPRCKTSFSFLIACCPFTTTTRRRRRRRRRSRFSVSRGWTRHVARLRGASAHIILRVLAVGSSRARGALDTHAMLRRAPWAALWIAAGLLCAAEAQYSSDQCSWRGSGLSHESHRRDVEQVYLRCSQGSLEWLYPTGAIIVNLRPNTEPSPGHMADLHACVKPNPSSQGSHVYVERAGDLTLLQAEEEHARGEVRCFSLAGGALFVEAVPVNDIGRRITAFQYELVSPTGPGGHMYPCKPCSDEEVLLAVCTSDFGVASGTSNHSPVVVSLRRLLRQKSRVFAWSGARGRRWSGRINVPAQCGVHAGGDAYLLTGSVHFGEAWLGCAPRYKDFLQLYTTAEKAGTNPCQIDTD